jgi:hypothetical protein
VWASFNKTIFKNLVTINNGNLSVQSNQIHWSYKTWNKIKFSVKLTSFAVKHKQTSVFTGGLVHQQSVYNICIVFTILPTQGCI